MSGLVHHSLRFGHVAALRDVDPEILERESKTSTVPAVWANYGIFWRDPIDFLSWLATMDETWLKHYDPATKQQSMEWWSGGIAAYNTPPPQKKIRLQKSARKVLASILWDHDSIFLTDYLPKG